MHIVIHTISKQLNNMKDQLVKAERQTMLKQHLWQSCSPRQWLLNDYENILPHEQWCVYLFPVRNSIMFEPVVPFSYCNSTLSSSSTIICPSQSLITLLYTTILYCQQVTKSRRLIIHYPMMLSTADVLHILMNFNLCLLNSGINCHQLDKLFINTCNKSSERWKPNQHTPTNEL